MTTKIIGSSTNMLLFWTVSVANLMAVGFQSDVLNYLTKPLLMASLTGWFLFATLGYGHRNIKLLFSAGLLCSMLGDILLMLVKSKGELFFIFGLGSFLIAHIFYSLTFIVFPNFYDGAICKNKILLLPFVVSFAIAIFYFWPSLGNLRNPVIVYAGIIITMSSLCFNMRGRVNSHIFIKLFAGAISFVFSDLIIALSKFKFTESNHVLSSLLIMSTYIIGQYLLARGMVDTFTNKGSNIT